MKAFPKAVTQVVPGPFRAMTLELGLCLFPGSFVTCLFAGTPLQAEVFHAAAGLPGAGCW
jgi:hypothetical protein